MLAQGEAQPYRSTVASIAHVRGRWLHAAARKRRGPCRAACPSSGGGQGSSPGLCTRADVSPEPRCAGVTTQKAALGGSRVACRPARAARAAAPRTVSVQASKVKKVRAGAV